MFRKKIRGISAVLMLLMFAGPAGAVEIKYNEQDRPVEFIGLEVGGTTWHVTVTWTGTMRGTYERSGVFVQPTFFGEAMADQAALAMQQALLADENAVNTLLTSYLWVPQASFGYYTGPGVWVHKAGFTIAPVNVNYDSNYGTVGYTRFRLFINSFEDQ